jgi:predicted DNA repair protein MutK
MNPSSLVAAVAATVAVGVHGGVGGRWVLRQLGAAALPASELFGDADVGRRIFLVTWHAVTAMFAVSAAALYLVGFETVTASPPLLRFIAALHVAVMFVGLMFMTRRVDAFVGKVPPVFVACMGTVAVGSWLASR